MSVEENGTGQFPSREDSTAQRSFDELARGLASGSVSRRRALRLLGGALAGSLIASFPGVAGATERHRNNGEPCQDPQKTRCNGICVDKQTNKNHCGGCRIQCEENERCCGGKCVNLEKGENHCGSCHNQCAAGVACVGGVCQGGLCNPTTCANGCCDDKGGCVAGTTDNACGTSGVMCKRCPTGTECLTGACVCTSTSCPHGCCQTIAGVPTCLEGKDQTTQACGTGGVTCRACPSGTECNNGVCECTKASCPNGCCQSTVTTSGTTSTCEMGNANTACGGGGDTCKFCKDPDNTCCPPGSFHAGQCKRGAGADCNGNGNCCSNICNSGVCA